MEKPTWSKDANPEVVILNYTTFRMSKNLDTFVEDVNRHLKISNDIIMQTATRSKCLRLVESDSERPKR
eukprot:UN04384